MGAIGEGSKSLAGQAASTRSRQRWLLGLVRLGWAVATALTASLLLLDLAPTREVPCPPGPVSDEIACIQRILPLFVIVGLGLMAGSAVWWATGRCSARVRADRDLRSWAAVASLAAVVFVFSLVAMVSSDASETVALVGVAIASVLFMTWLCLRLGRGSGKG